ncbi:hypothetical protein N7495_002804 [Penicillium taxi]|uniref:uncharacterized protein n=1 Tax=Penicillium taxi TaxID=168475 RepID=UPI0025450A35|nr:uncharacterized protein N7495_002804 [Penicillium taxi]KAJ5902276.1 hypothetical protein N7495_002804 [Penicillium taxi]
MSMAPGPDPKSHLGRYRLLAPTAAVKVSPLCLGTLNFGESWKGLTGECDKENSFKILDTYYEKGGNFIDTANNYHDGESETWLGEWLETRGNRDEIVLATKYTSGYRKHNPSEIQANYIGSNAKGLRVSVENSLRNLRTSYIDLLYVHWWDWSTSIEEVMTSLNQLVTSGKVIYLGISDTPAWIVSRANQCKKDPKLQPDSNYIHASSNPDIDARDHGLRPFSVYQGRWNAASRDFERDIIPMCRAEGMGICPWAALGAGQFKTTIERTLLAAGPNPGRQTQPSSTDIAISKVLENVALRHDTAITSVALAYLMHKFPYVYPVVGGRKVEHLLGNIEALTLVLGEEDMREIEGAVEFDVGFPMNFLFRGVDKEAWAGNQEIMKVAARFDYPGIERPIVPKGLLDM